MGGKKKNKEKSTPTPTEIENSFADALPEDKILFDRTVNWAQFIKRIEQTQKNESENDEQQTDFSVANLEDDFKEFYEVLNEESDCESMKSEDFESQTEDDNYDHEEALKLTIPAIIEREKYWKQCNSIDKIMETLSIVNLSDLPTKIFEKSFKPIKEQYQSLNSNTMNHFNDLDESSMGSIETICYIKKNSKKKIDRNKFNQKIKLNRMRNSKNLNLNSNNDYVDLNSNGSYRDQSNWQNKCDSFLKSCLNQHSDESSSNNYSFEEQYIIKQKYTKHRSSKQGLDAPIKNICSSIKNCNLFIEAELKSKELFNPDLSFNLSFFKPPLNSTSSENDNNLGKKIQKKKKAALSPISEAFESPGSLDVGYNFDYLNRPVIIKQEIIDISDISEKDDKEPDLEKSDKNILNVTNTVLKKQENKDLNETNGNQNVQENKNKSYLPDKSNKVKKARKSLFTESFSNKSKRNSNSESEVQTKRTSEEKTEIINGTLNCIQTDKNETASEKQSSSSQNSKQNKTKNKKSSKVDSTITNCVSMNIQEPSFQEKNKKSEPNFFTKRKLLSNTSDSNVIERTQNSRSQLNGTYQNTKLNELSTSQNLNFTEPLNSFLSGFFFTPPTVQNISRLNESNKLNLKVLSVLPDDSGSEDEIAIIRRGCTPTSKNKKNYQS